MLDPYQQFQDGVVDPERSRWSRLGSPETEQHVVSPVIYLYDAVPFPGSGKVYLRQLMGSSGTYSGRSGRYKGTESITHRLLLFYYSGPQIELTHSSDGSAHNESTKGTLLNPLSPSIIRNYTPQTMVLNLSSGCMEKGSTGKECMGVYSALSQVEIDGTTSVEVVCSRCSAKFTCNITMKSTPKQLA